MVSTRGHNTKYKFTDGEKVLCYEPDPTKAKVLYDSKVLEVSEGKDKRGRRIVEYLIHFQGWNSSWDRKVSEDFILKDTEENRQLQKDLAEKSQLYQGGYLYRKERKKQRAKSLTDRIESLTNAKAQPHTHASSEEGSSCSNGFSRDDNESNIDDMDEYYSSSVESSHEEEKVYLQAGGKFRKYLDYDQHLIMAESMLVELPAKLPVVTILEDFVRYYTIRQLFECGHQEQTKSRRRNSSALRSEHKVRDYEQIRTNVDLCKEVADGLRVYFDFTLQDYLLYPQEKPQALVALSEESLCNFTYIASQNLSLDMLTVRLESPTTDVQPISEHSDSSALASTSAEERRRRRLRSHKNEENEFVLDFAALQQQSAAQGHSQQSVATERAGNVSPFGSSLNILRSIIPQNVIISREAKEVLDEVFRWRILPSNAPPEPSMIYGAIHLARLIVKLPEFLSATQMTDEKLKLLLRFLDTFAEFIEEHEEWFGKQFYFSLRDGDSIA
ncbi:protein male-specific lethal-3 [Anopheles nili]|uniref:protein male-specific lethal-3 n=1 Tax=Anopheles nili TaxID=185578 RepID=UPI00237B5C6A|nr:protein male-specific lethal-3 [Anopheles nili]